MGGVDSAIEVNTLKQQLADSNAHIAQVQQHLYDARHRLTDSETEKDLYFSKLSQLDAFFGDISGRPEAAENPLLQEILVQVNKILFQEG